MCVCDLKEMVSQYFSAVVTNAPDVDGRDDQRVNILCGTSGDSGVVLFRSLKLYNKLPFFFLPFFLFLSLLSFFLNGRLLE